MDRVDDTPGGSLYTLDCLQGQPSEHSRPIFAEEQEIACMQLAWLSFRSEMKYYENKNEKDSYWIRSDVNDKLARDIDREHQIDEIERKIPIIKEMLSYQVRAAEDLGITHTAEFEEAHRKLMEIGIIEGKLQTTREKIQTMHKRFNCCIAFCSLLLLIFLIYAIIYALKKPDNTYELLQKQAEKALLEYSKESILDQKNRQQSHMDDIKTYQDNQKDNLLKVESVLDAPISDIDTQISYVEAMITNKLNLLGNGMYTPDNIHKKLVEIRTINQRMLDYKFEKEEVVT